MEKIFNSVECLQINNLIQQILPDLLSSEYNIISTQEEKHGKFELVIEDITTPEVIGFELNVDGILSNTNKNHVKSELNFSEETLIRLSIIFLNIFSKSLYFQIKRINLL